ncbi:hypothetical protein HPB51_026172 [Rhipicephalus microplus]|uniref:Uncharacterized protein n=1 Tax=Rhipicephalus microplus TaxID=6941 RepID=A0A9J6EDY5_RHIMP|nr:hypothetical protein HPB51_026172 [Rhipicephalus microplus]
METSSLTQPIKAAVQESTPGAPIQSTVSKASDGSPFSSGNPVSPSSPLRDHYIIQTIVKAGPQYRKAKQPELVYWDVFRELQASASPESATSIDQWAASLLRDVKRATMAPPEEAVGDTVDTMLLHMWEALAGSGSSTGHQDTEDLSPDKELHCRPSGEVKTLGTAALCLSSHTLTSQPVDLLHDS